MRYALVATITAATLAGPAFAGAPTPPTPPSPPHVAPVNITVTTANGATGGGSVSNTVHAGPITVAYSISGKTTVFLGTSQTVSIPGSGGYTVP
jgi:hypothetical protein